MTAEKRLAEWEKRSGMSVSNSEHRFISALREAAISGVGYGWMQQVIEWEWASKSSHSWGPEYFERERIAATKATAARCVEICRTTDRGTIYDAANAIKKEFDLERYAENGCSKVYHR